VRLTAEKRHDVVGSWALCNVGWLRAGSGEVRLCLPFFLFCFEETRLGLLGELVVRKRHACLLVLQPFKKIFSSR
jgi:hypothetical protein